MFDNDAADPATVLAAATAAQQAARLAGVDLLQCGLAWADLHGVVDGVDVGLPGAARLKRLGGAGTPEVDDLSVAEFAVTLGMSAGSASRLIGDALDLRHRLPAFWALVRAGEVEVWVARRIASLTRELDEEAAAAVDKKAAQYASLLSVQRLLICVDGWVMAAAPGLAEDEVERRRDEHGVWVTRATDHGTKTLVVKGEAADVIAFDAAVGRVADGLALLGSPESRDIRRARSVGVLASPQQVLDLYAAAEQAAKGALNQGLSLPDDIVVEPADLPPADPEVDWADRDQPAICGRSIKVDPRPKATLYVHVAAETLSQAGADLNPDHPVARVEGIGPVYVDQVRRWLRDRSVTVKPVIDLAGVAPVDGYEIPERIREATRLLMPADAFPYAPGTTSDPDQINGTRSFDLDHSTAYRSPDTGGPPGQTAVGKLTPMRRTGHRVKTHAGWQSAQPFPAIVVWRSPHGAVLATTPTGTHRLN